MTDPRPPSWQRRPKVIGTPFGAGGVLGAARHLVHVLDGATIDGPPALLDAIDALRHAVERASKGA